MKDVQCYELFGGITLKNHAFSFFYHFHVNRRILVETCIGRTNTELFCFFIME